MNSKKTVLIILCVLLALCAVAAVIHLRSREAVPEGAILLTQNGQTSYFSAEELSLIPVQGTVMNGKGEEKPIDAQGVALASLASGEFSVIKVTADDEYSAEVGADEVENAWLIFSENEARLIVFGDQNAKRDIKHVVKIEIS